MTQSSREFFLHELRSVPVEVLLVNSKNPYDRLLFLRQTPVVNSGRVNFWQGHLEAHGPFRAPFPRNSYWISMKRHNCG